MLCPAHDPHASGMEVRKPLNSFGRQHGSSNQNNGFRLGFRVHGMLLAFDERVQSGLRWRMSQYFELINPFADPPPGSTGGLMVSLFRASEWPSLNTTTPVPL